MAATQLAVQPEVAVQPRTVSRIARNVAFLAGGQLVTWCLSLLWTLFVPRALGPRGLGELTVAYAVTGVISVVVSLGIGTLMVKEIARDRAKASWLVGTAFLVRAGFVIPSLAALALYIRLVHFGGEQAIVIWLAAGSMVLALFTGPLQAAFQAYERMEYLAYADVLTKAVVSVASIALVLMGFGVVAIMALAVAMAAVVLALNVWWSTGKFGVDWHIDRQRIRFLVVDSLPYWTTGLVLTFYLWIDSVMLSFLSSTEVVGWYAVPTKLFSTLLFVPVILGTAWLPRLSAAYREGPEEFRRTGRPALELVIVLGLPVAVGTALVAGRAIHDIYGPAFAPSVIVMIILAASVPPTYMNIMFNQVLVAANRQIAWTKVMVSAAVINPALNLVLIRYFQAQQHNGAIGAALSLLVTEIGMAAVGLMLIPRVFSRSSLRRLASAALATAGMAVAAVLAARFGLIIEIAAGAAAFGVLAAALRLVTSDELAAVHPRLAAFPLGRVRPLKAADKT